MEIIVEGIHKVDEEVISEGVEVEEMIMHRGINIMLFWARIRQRNFTQ